MGIDDYLLTSTINLLIGQRLVRKLCLACRLARRASAELLEHWGIGDVSAETVLYHAVGCAACNYTGYAGRTSIIELLELNEPLQKLILGKSDATALEKAAVAGGMRTMFDHGIQAALAGVTTLEEVLRVTRMSAT
jgi:general secretion pathway protein E